MAGQRPPAETASRPQATFSVLGPAFFSAHERGWRIRLLGAYSADSGGR